MSLTSKEAVALSEEAEALHSIHKIVTAEADEAYNEFRMMSDSMVLLYATAPAELKEYAADKSINGGGTNLKTLMGHVLVEYTFQAGDAQALVLASIETGKDHLKKYESGYWELALMEDAQRRAEALLASSESIQPM